MTTRAEAISLIEYTPEMLKKGIFEADGRNIYIGEIDKIALLVAGCMGNKDEGDTANAKYIAHLLNHAPRIIHDLVAENEVLRVKTSNYLNALQDFANNGDIDFKIAFDKAEAELNEALTRNGAWFKEQR